VGHHLVGAMMACIGFLADRSRWKRTTRRRGSPLGRKLFGQGQRRVVRVCSVPLDLGNSHLDEGYMYVVVT